MRHRVIFPLAVVFLVFAPLILAPRLWRNGETSGPTDQPGAQVNAELPDEGNDAMAWSSVGDVPAPFSTSDVHRASGRTAHADFFADAPVLDERWRSGTLPGTWIHERLVGYDKGNHRIIRVTETWSTGGDGQADRLMIREALAGDQIIVQFSGDLEREEVDELAASAGLSVRRVLRDPGLVVLGTSEHGLDIPERAVAAVMQFGDLVQFAEPDPVVRAFDITPSDPQLASQWHLVDEAAGIHAPAGWSIRKEAPDVIVAVVDTGIRLDHEDLAGNLWTNGGEIAGNGVDDDQNGYVDDVHGIDVVNGDSDPDDDDGHGTAVAGVIGARGDNAKGVAGIAWRVQLMPVKFLNSEGLGTVSDSIVAIDYAIANGAHIINASWGSDWRHPTGSQAESEALERARAAGVVFVAAAGNDGIDIDATPVYPASFTHDNIVTVGSFGQEGRRSGFSNFGLTAVDLAAPGENILTLWNSSTSATGYKTGTSLAAPVVSGMLALIRAQFPAEDYRSWINRLLAGVDLIDLDPFDDARWLSGGIRAAGTPRLDRALSQPALPEFPHVLNGASVRSYNILTGDSLSIGVPASGGDPLIHRWMRRRSLFAETFGTVDFENVTSLDGGQYVIRTFNPAGWTYSRVDLHFVAPNWRIGQAFDLPEIAWSVREPYVSIDDRDYLEGSDSAGLYVTEPGERREIEATVTGSGLLTFYMKRVFPGDEAVFEVTVNDSVVVSFTESTNDAWEKVFVPLTEQRNKIRIVLRKTGRSPEDNYRILIDSMRRITDEVHFTLHPEPVDALLGGSVRLEGRAAGARPISYQWYRDGLPVDGATTPVLQIQESNAEDVGRYWLQASNASGSATSDPALVRLLEVPEPPVIIYEPPRWDRSTRPGGTIEYSIGVDGTGPIEVSWYRDNVLLPEFRGTEIRIQGVVNEEIGRYRVVVRGPGGTASKNLSPYYYHGGITAEPYVRFREVYEGEPLELGFQVDSELQIDSREVEWIRDHTTLPKGEGERLVREAAAVQDDGSYRAVISLLRGGSGAGVVTLGPVEVRVVRSMTGMAEVAADPELPWRTWAKHPWAIVDDPEGKRGSVLRSGEVGPEGESIFELPVNGPALVSFDARVSSESYADGLEIRLDHNRMDFLSGELGWSGYTVDIPAGSHLLEWAYIKDEAGTFGGDGVWLDSLTVVSDPPRLVSPQLLRVVAGEEVALQLVADSAQSMSVEGLPSGLSFDADTRVISGSVSSPGDFDITVVLRGTDTVVREQAVLSISPTMLPYRSYTYPGVAYPNGAVRRVVHGNGRFVAVGNDRLLAHSADGIRWDYVVPDWPPANMRDATYGGGRFVAVGDVGILYTSEDGERWERNRTVPRYTLNAVAFGNGAYVAVGELGIVLVSMDAVTWIAHFTSERESLVGVGYAGGRFLAVDRLGHVYESAEGTAWTMIDGRARAALGYAVITDQGIVARAEPDSAWTGGEFDWFGYAGTDGWRRLRGSDGSVLSGALGYGDGKFLMATRFAVWESADGLNWESISPILRANSAPVALCWMGAAWMRWANEPWISADGRDWTRAFRPPYSDIGGQRVLAARSRLLSRGVDAWYVSADGSDWTRAPEIPDGLDKIDDFGDQLVGQSSTPRGLYVSEDGMNWSWLQNNVAKTLRDLVRVGDEYYAVAYENGGQWRYLYRSANLADWEQITAQSPVPLYSFSRVRGRFYAGGLEGQVLVSDDGETWEMVFEGVRQPKVGRPRGFTDAGGIIVAYGIGGYIVSSHDGETWFQRRSPTAADFDRMIYDGRVFVLVSHEQFVVVSADGINWRAEYLPIFSRGAGSMVAYRGGLFMGGEGLVQLGHVLPALPPAYAGLAPHQVPLPGQSVRLSVEAGGERPFSYRWMKNGVEIPEAEESWLDIETFSAEAAGEYAVRIANDFGEVTSAPVIVAPAATVVSGVYRGRIRNEDNSGEGGEFTLWIRDNGTAVFLGLREDGVAVVDENLVVTTDGRIAEPAVGAAFAGDTKDRVLAVGTDRGVIGSVGLRSFFGARVGDADAKLLEGVVAYSSGVRLRALQPASGEGFVLVSGGDALAITLPEGADAIAFDTDAGAYQVSLSGAGISGTFVSADSSNWPLLAVGTEGTDGAVLANISTRGEVQAGDSMLIAGFVVQGSGTRRLLIRAAGPALAAFGVADPLLRPRIELKSALGEDLGQNAGWGGVELVTELNLLTGAFDFASGSDDAALVVTLPAGSYTAQVSGTDGGRGVSLVEVYDGDVAVGGAAKVVNISTRGSVTGTDTFLISGFVLTGNQPRLVLVRGIGPALGEFGLAGYLPDPELEVYDAESRSVRFNDDWDEGGDAGLVSESAEQVGAFALTPGSGDAAVLMWLAPGAYTAHVRSADGQGGVALAEIYEVP